MRLQSLLVMLETVMLVLFHCQVYGFNFLYGHVEELGFFFFSSSKAFWDKNEGKNLEESFNWGYSPWQYNLTVTVLEKRSYGGE